MYPPLTFFACRRTPILASRKEHAPSFRHKSRRPSRIVLPRRIPATASSRHVIVSADYDVLVQPLAEVPSASATPQTHTRRVKHGSKKRSASTSLVSCVARIIRRRDSAEKHVRVLLHVGYTVKTVGLPITFCHFSSGLRSSGLRSPPASFSGIKSLSSLVSRRLCSSTLQTYSYAFAGSISECLLVANTPPVGPNESA